MHGLTLYTCRACAAPGATLGQPRKCPFCESRVCEACGGTTAGAPGKCCRSRPAAPPRKRAMIEEYVEEPKRVEGSDLRALILRAPGPVDCLCVANTMTVEHHFDYFFKELKAYGSGHHLANFPHSQKNLERAISNFGLGRTVFFWRLSQVWAEGAAFIPIGPNIASCESVCAKYTENYTYDVETRVSYYPRSRLLVVGDTFPRDEASMIVRGLILTDSYDPPGPANKNA